ncbi:ATPase family gene 2 protein homolog A-like isoform X2 [Centruroides vittatus]|uniref:ATPase family gene 2 protein homolog A-like isoform X2 n=1 Tax=Centruroides vittatus TaxID=120091 RepID=UPI00350FE8DE
MPKKSKSQWRKCENCKSVLCMKDVQLHKEQCDELKNESNKCLILNHCLIDNENLYATVIKDDFQKGDKDLQLFSKNSVFLHPSTMKMCNICFGDRITLTSSSGYQILCTVLPKSSLSLTTISVMKNDFSEDYNEKIICVRKYLKYPLKAESLTILCESSSRKDLFSNGFKTIFIRNYYDTYVTFGTKLSFSYFGNIYQLKIVDVVGENCDDENQIRNSPDCLSFKMDALKLEESIDEPDVNSKSEISKSKEYHNRTETDFNSEVSGSETSLLCSTPLNTNRSLSNLFTVKDSPVLRDDYLKRAEDEIQFYLITMKTNIKFVNETQKDDTSDIKITFDKIGGLDRQISLLKELIYPIICPRYFRIKGVQLPKGIILHGPSGTGKTMIGNAIPNEYQVNFILINGGEIYSSEAKLREIFSEAKRRAPSIIFIDEFDVLCPKNQDSSLQVERRVLATLSTLMDSLSYDHAADVFVIGATNKPDLIDESLRRPGRFDREIETGYPNNKERFEILKKLLEDKKHSLTEENMNEIAEKLHGYTGADLNYLCRNVSFMVMKEQSNDLVMSLSHFNLAIKEMKPSALKEMDIQISKVYWQDIGGMHEVKQKLKEAIEWPVKHPEIFQKMGLPQRHGILMYGPPGCSKTMIAKALATESGLNFLAIKGPELFSKWVGESERNVREIFRIAKNMAPCIIFFDEIDGLAVERGSSEGSNVGDRVLTQLLTEIDGMEQLKNVFIVAATNRPDMIDKALLRPGRLDSIIYVPLPDASSRKEILEIKLKKQPTSSDVDISLLTEHTKGFSGAEIVALCHEAGLRALNENINAEQITWSHFMQALEFVKPRTTTETIEYYKSYFEKDKKQ